MFANLFSAACHIILFFLFFVFFRSAFFHINIPHMDDGMYYNIAKVI